MSVAREFFAATKLTNGRVLVTGGRDNLSNFLDSAELFNPKTDKFTSTGNLTSPRSFHAFVILTGGKVLVVGGLTGSGVLSSADLYNPKTGKFSSTGGMSEAREDFEIVPLLSGVLIGGWPDDTAEIYKSGKFAPAGSMSEKRTCGAASAVTSAMSGIYLSCD